MVYQKIIDLLKTDDYYIVKKDVDVLINDEEFLKMIVKVHNPFVFDRFMKMCEYKIDTSPLYEKRNKFIEKTLLNIKEDELLDFFELKKIDNAIASRYLSEYIIGYYFQDSYYNFLTNFNQMIGYLSSVKKPLVDSSNIKEYEDFIKIKDLSFDEKIKFFQDHLNSNLMEQFYDDLNIVRNDSHKELVDKSLKLNHDNGLYNRDISRRFDVDVYMLDGQKFNAFVRVLSLNRTDLSDQYDYVNSISDRLGYSFSYISNINIGTIDYTKNNVVLFYDNINYQNIMYVHHGDLHAKRMVKQDDYLSEKENEIFTPSSLTAHTNNYNEIYIKKDVNGFKPKALICYDKITISDISFAKKYDLVILIIDTKKYQSNKSYEDDYESYSYTI